MIAYRAGERDEAVRRVTALTRTKLDGDVGVANLAFDHPDMGGPGIDASFLVAAAMLHTDAAHALWPTSLERSLQRVEAASTPRATSSTERAERFQPTCRCMWLERG